jgi:hypothetical protein
MTKFATRMMMTAAAATMAFAPIAAQAGTRASDKGSVYSVSAPGVGRAANGEEQDGGSASAIIIGLLAAAAVIAGIYFVADSNDNGQSPGT